MVVVVVLPCVPPTATVHFKRISSASISARRTTGMERRRASRSSGLSGLMALLMTMAPTPSTCSARWPMNTVAPSARKRSTMALSFMSEPCTW